MSPYKEGRTLDILYGELAHLRNLVANEQLAEAEAVAVSMAANAISVEFFAIAHAAYRIKVAIKCDPEGIASIDDLLNRLTEAVHRTLAF